MIIILSDWYGRLRWKLCKKARVSMEKVPPWIEIQKTEVTRE